MNNTEIYKDESKAVEVKPPEKKTDQINKILNNLTAKGSPYMNKFKGQIDRMNRAKALKISGIVFLVLLIMMVALMLLKGQASTQKTTNVPPKTENKEVLTTGSSEMDNKLNELRDKVQTYRLDESNLAPPEINFDIKF
jgi:hypothetical protein